MIQCKYLRLWCRYNIYHKDMYKNNRLKYYRTDPINFYLTIKTKLLNRRNKFEFII
jgi:hypothetical protein